MNQESIIEMQQRVGVVADGFWGPKSITACQAYLRALFPRPHPWPWADQRSLSGFYGPAGDESRLVSISFPFPMFYEGRLCRTTRCHERVAESLLRVLSALGDRYEEDKKIMDPGSDYGGCYNNRVMRGGSLPSLHARGAAIDLDADDNGNRVPWPVAADMPLEVMECFAREGWISAGAFWGRDAMHFQATQ